MERKAEQKELDDFSRLAIDEEEVGSCSSSNNLSSNPSNIAGPMAVGSSSEMGTHLEVSIVDQNLAAFQLSSTSSQQENMSEFDMIKARYNRRVNVETREIEDHSVLQDTQEQQEYVVNVLNVWRGISTVNDVSGNGDIDEQKEEDELNVLMEHEHEASVVNDTLPVAILVPQYDEFHSGDEVIPITTKVLTWYETRSISWKISFGLFWTILIVGITAAAFATQNKPVNHNSQMQGLSNTIEDMKAIIDVYNVTQGERWHNNTGWAEYIKKYEYNEASLANYVCDFYGIYCEPDGIDGVTSRKITIIKFANNKLVGSIDETFRLLASIKTLEFIDVSSNSLSGNVTSAIQYFVNKPPMTLSLVGNPVVGYIPESACYATGSLGSLEKRTIWADCHISCGCCSYKKPCQH